MDARHKTNYYPRASAPPRYMDLEKLVTPFAKDVAFRWSFNHVPHLLVELGRGIIYSLCYFKNHNSWRVFFPYRVPSRPQQKQDFSSVEDMLKFLRRHKPRKVTIESQN